MLRLRNASQPVLCGLFCLTTPYSIPASSAELALKGGGIQSIIYPRSDALRRNEIEVIFSYVLLLKFLREKSNYC